MFLSMVKVALALPILATTGASEPPCLSTILLMYANESTSTNGSPQSYCDWIVIGGVYPHDL